MGRNFELQISFVHRTNRSEQVIRMSIEARRFLSFFLAVFSTLPEFLFDEKPFKSTEKEKIMQQRTLNLASVENEVEIIENDSSKMSHRCSEERNDERSKSKCVLSR